MRTLALIGAPTSAGAFAPGQEDAPSALRAAGLVQAPDLAYGTSWEREAIARLELAGYAAEEVDQDPLGTAQRANELARRAAPHRLVRFDVDTIDFVDMPLSENTGRNYGLPVDTAMAALDVLLDGEDLAAVTITELNPHHGAEDGSTLTAFALRLASAFAQGARAG